MLPPSKSPDSVSPTNESDDGRVLAAVAISLVLAIACLILFVYNWIVASLAIGSFVLLAGVVGFTSRGARRVFVLTIA